MSHYVTGHTFLIGSVKYLCHRCYVAFAKKGKFEIDDEFCKKTKRSIINSLEYLIKLKEKEVIA